METKVLRIEIKQYRRTDLMVAFSDDLPGLLVHGRGVDQLVERLPQAIAELFEARGEPVPRISLRDDDLGAAGFGPPSLVADLASNAAAR